MASGRMLLRLGVVLCLGAAVAASPIDLEDVAAAQAAQARDGLPERLEPLVTSVENEQAFEEFIQLHKPSLGKVLFFSKLGVSELCESLAEHFDGQLDVLHISPNATDVAAKFQNEELPAVYYMPPQVSNQGDSATLQLLKYEGNFKFGGTAIELHLASMCVCFVKAALFDTDYSPYRSTRPHRQFLGRVRYAAWLSLTQTLWLVNCLACSPDLLLALQLLRFQACL